MSLAGREVHDATVGAELHVILAAHDDGGLGAEGRVKGHGHGSVALHALGLANVVQLIEVVGLASFLAGPLQVGLSDNLDFHVLFTSFFFVLQVWPLFE